MAYKPPVAVYDACVLYPFHLRNVLVQCGVERLVDVRWTDEIHDEWIGNLAANGLNLTVERLENTRDLMKRVLPGADVTDYDHLIPNLTLPDPDDRHVLAAAIKGGASHIVSWNLKDFLSSALAPHHLIAQNPDGFLMGLYAAAPDATIAVAANARKNLIKTTPTVAEFIDTLEQQKLTRFGAVLRNHDKRI